MGTQPVEDEGLGPAGVRRHHRADQPTSSETADLRESEPFQNLLKGASRSSGWQMAHQCQRCNERQQQAPSASLLPLTRRALASNTMSR
jgi:hypothetical protein